MKDSPTSPSAIRAEKFLKHLNQARKHLSLVDHLVPEGCCRTFSEIDFRLQQIKRFTEAEGQLR